MSGQWWQYLGVFVGSTVLSLALTPLAIRFATRRDILDRPGRHKSHTRAVPYLGGVAILVSFSAVVLVATWLDSTPSVAEELVKVVGVAMGLAMVGLIDDLRGLPPVLRLAVEVGAGAALYAWDLGVAFTGSGPTDALVTILWVVGLVNAFNMSDNMDGLSAGLAAIASASLFAVAVANGQFLVATLSAALAGCAIGFLRSNVFPALIYMGDAGAYFLGFVIAYLGLQIQFLTDSRDNTFLVPIIIVSVVIFDTTLVSVSRLAHRLSPMTAGRDHTSHRLVRVGLPVPVAVGVIHASAVAVGVVAFVVARVDDTSGWILAGLVGAFMAVAGVLLGLVPVYETSTRPLVTISRAPSDPARPDPL